MSHTIDKRINRGDRATIEDVANAAGVSVATVSRALRGLPNVAISTRERVRSIATEMSYRADPAASRLATGRTRVVGVAVPVLNTWYFSNVVAGVEAVCSESGYDTAVFGVSTTDQRRRLIDGDDAVHRRVDGMIFVDIALQPDEIASLGAHGLEAVMIGADAVGKASIGIDDVEVGRIAARHLLGLGHRRIALLLGQVDDPLAFDVPHLRRHGFEIECRTAGIELDPLLSVVGNFSVEGAIEAFEALMSLDQPPTAVFALSDEMAFGVLQAARGLDIEVPGDVSVIGVDDHDLAAVVGLTTVRQDVADHGARAARAMLDHLAGKDIARNRSNAEVRLIERDTTGAPPSGVTESP